MAFDNMWALILRRQEFIYVMQERRNDQAVAPAPPSNSVCGIAELSLSLWSIVEKRYILIGHPTNRSIL